MMKKKLLAIAVVSLGIYGCVGGGSSDDTASTSTGTTTVEGAVADGYIENATVCLDMNVNGQCDPDEPSAVTDAQGRYSFSASQEDIDKYPVLAEFNDNSLDHGDGTGNPVAFNPGFSMTSVPGKASFISPYTTLVAGKTLEGMTPDAAAIAVQEALGTTTSPFEDFIQKNDATLKKAAPAIVGVIEKAIQSGDSTGASRDQIVAVAIQKATNVLPVLGDLIKQGDDPDTVANKLADVVTVRQSDIDALAGQLEMAKSAQPVTIDALLDKYWYQVDEESNSQIIRYRLTRTDATSGSIGLKFCDRTDQNCLAAADDFSVPVTFEGGTVTTANGTYTASDVVVVDQKNTPQAVLDYAANSIKAVLNATSVPSISENDHIVRIAGVVRKRDLPNFASEQFSSDGWQPDNYWNTSNVESELSRFQNAGAASPFGVEKYGVWMAQDKKEFYYCPLELDASGNVLYDQNNNVSCIKDASGNPITFTINSRYQSGQWASGESYVAVLDIWHYLDAGVRRIWVVTDSQTGNYEKSYYLEDAAKVLWWFNDSLMQKISTLQ